MKSIEANAISIKQYLSENGIHPAKDSSRYGMYHSPFREDHNASLKVDYNQNVWHDFGTGEGGGLIDMVMKMQNSTFYEVITMLEKELKNFSSFSFHGNQNHFSDGTITQEPSISIQEIQPINSPALIKISGCPKEKGTDENTMICMVIGTLVHRYISTLVHQYNSTTI